MIVSSHHTVAEGVITRADQVHVCYCQTPMRSLWERPAAELATLPRPMRQLGAVLLSHLRVWDAVTAARVDHFVANSTTTRRRIASYYRRESEIVFPPIEPISSRRAARSEIMSSSPRGPYHISAVRDRRDRATRSAVAIGGGKHTGRDAPPNVELLGRVCDEELRVLMRGARAPLFPQYEDFGMTPLEVNACGRRVIAFGKGGALDTFVDGVTGLLVPEQSVAGFVEALNRFERFERLMFDSAAARDHALSFSRYRFVAKMRAVVEDAWRSRLGEVPVRA